jgi:hypothetical protein
MAEDEMWLNTATAELGSTYRIPVTYQNVETKVRNKKELMQIWVLGVLLGGCVGWMLGTVM